MVLTFDYVLLPTDFNKIILPHLQLISVCKSTTKIELVTTILILKHFSKALEYCNLAKSFAIKLGLKGEIKNIDKKMDLIIKSMNYN